MNRKELLDEAHWERMFANAYAGVPEPESIKLKEMETRLTATLPKRNAKQPRAWFGWMLVGFATVGAAAWWVGDYVESRVQDSVHHAPSADMGSNESGVSSGSRAVHKPTSPTGGSEERSEKSTIYRRERR